MANIYNWLMAPCGGLRLDPDTFEIVMIDGKPCLSSLGGGGGITGNYLKEAEVAEDGSLKLTNKDGSEVVYGQGGLVADIDADGDTLVVTRTDGTVFEYAKLPSEAIKNAFLSDGGATLTLVKSDDTFIRFSGGQPEEYIKKVTFNALTGEMRFTRKDDTVQEYTVYPQKYIQTAVVNEDGDLELTREDGVKTTYVAGLPEHYVSSISYEPVTNLFTYKNEVGEYNITIEPPLYTKKVTKTDEALTFTDQDGDELTVEIVSTDDFEEWLEDH